MRRHWVAVARGDAEPDLVLKGGTVLSVFTGELFGADVAIADGHVVGVGSYDGARVDDVSGQFVLPGFIDGHCHIESSKLDVPEFARAVLRTGTTAVVTDPHELANVLGLQGIEYVLRASHGLPLRVYVTLPSCVPASALESPAIPLEACDYPEILRRDRVIGIAEMMNYPAAIAGDAALMGKMALMGYRHIDGHAPQVQGRDLNAYIVSGPSSDHECTTLEEALEKRRLGMWVMIREASMIRNLEALLPLVKQYGTENTMFVTDDREAGTLIEEGHMNAIVRKAVKCGLSAGEAVKLATLNVARYHELPLQGAVAPGYAADIQVLPDLDSFVPSRVYSRGRLVAAGGETLPFVTPERDIDVTQTVRLRTIGRDSFAIPHDGSRTVRVIELIPHQVVTRSGVCKPCVVGGAVVADTENDVLKVAVVERHAASGRIGVGLVRGFGLKRGAIASTVAHDAHNVVVVGVVDADMCVAVQHLGAIGGGLVVAVDGQIVGDLPLEIAGLMSVLPVAGVVERLKALHRSLRDLGVTIDTPFMYLSFLALSVIPELRITDRGLVDVRSFDVVPLGIS
ncbi:MAG: adenine deaminase [Chloroflexota bacterium]